MFTRVRAISDCLSCTLFVLADSHQVTLSFRPFSHSLAVYRNDLHIYNIRDDYDLSWVEFLSRFRTAIGGRGILLNAPFFAADAIAGVFESVNHFCCPSREPLLHRLLVRFFGRSSGHSSKKIQHDCGRLPMCGFDEALENSVRWFLNEHSGG